MAIKVYTCGAMKNKTTEEAMAWRNELENCLNMSGVVTSVFKPPKFYNYDNLKHQSEAEIKEFELAKLRESDVLVVELDGIESSVGSCMELGYANAMNDFGNKHIFIIAYNNTGKNVHPWVIDSCIRVEDSLEDIAYYIVNYVKA